MTTTPDLAFVQVGETVHWPTDLAPDGHLRAVYFGRIDGNPTFRCLCGVQLTLSDEQLADLGFCVAP